MGRISGIMIIVSALAAGGCADIPIHDVSKSFAVEVSHISEGADPIQLDFLWIIDNSSSMVQEHRALSANFDQFVEILQSNLNIDIRLAVTTTDAVGQAGSFVNTPAQVYPLSAAQSHREPCLGAMDCQKLYGPGWSCQAVPAEEMHNFNGSVNTACVYRCEDDGECCQEFCTGDCGSDQSCVQDMCQDAPHDQCTIQCSHAGEQSSGCIYPPDTADCAPNLPEKLTLKNLDHFKCLATVEVVQSGSASMEQGLKSAWLALDPDGVNSNQSAGFLRPGAYLVIVFVTDEDDCSVHEEFCAPNDFCDSPSEIDKCQKSGGTCKTDVAYSYFRGEETKLCCGIIKKDYFDSCALMGDFLGVDHHELAYDPTLSDCVVDEDCPDDWTCVEQSGQFKCLPEIYGFSNMADFVEATGAPLFSMRPVVDYYSRFRSLKPDPAKVLVAAITGDALLAPGAEQSMISAKCLGEKGDAKDLAVAAKLAHCIEYKSLKEAAENNCEENPDVEACRYYSAVKTRCIRQCYVASKGNKKHAKRARNSYVCQSPFGQADYGARYIQLSQMFGPNGVVANMCAEEGIAPALQRIADLIISRVTKVCLPLPVRKSQVNCNVDDECREYLLDQLGVEATGPQALCDQTSGFCQFQCEAAEGCESLGLACNNATGHCQDPIVVTKKQTHLDGTVEITELDLGITDESGYQFKFEPEDCCFPDPETQECTGARMAITFNENLAANATVEVKYAADLSGDGE